jgi:aspartyl-tRNA(Asn)/glutamyl-tRNA(Gln) amidotransferase subunit C
MARMAAEITRDDVAHLAGLARIQLDDAELDRLGEELPKILESVATVSQALEGAGEVEPMSHPTPLRNVFREDVVHESLSPEAALAGAPASEEQRFLVPKILGEE